MRTPSCTASYEWAWKGARIRGPLFLVIGALLGPAVGATGCSRTGSKSPEGTTMLQANMHVRSAAFDYNRPIPKRFTEDGEDLSPELAWSEVPAETKEFAIIVDDPDAPSSEPWVHWILYKIPGTATGLPDGAAHHERLDSPGGAAQGKNSWGTIGYRGPAPPRGPVHHYAFKVYALDAPLDLKPGADKQTLEKAMAGHILAEGELMGTYQRQ